MKKTYVNVKFDNYGGSKKYTYYTNLDFNVGDFAVVNVSGDYKVVEITEKESSISQSRKDKCFKWIVDKVDLTKYNEIIEREERVKELKAKLDSRKSELDEIAIYKYLAETDDSMRDLLNELKTLTGV